VNAVVKAHSGAVPGRTCPVSYRHAPSVFDREPEIVADTLYVVGGLYGNVEALRAIEMLARDEATPPVIVFNGDFHWFDVDGADFAAIDRGVMRHRALRGNVETELANDEGDAGCGCAYPDEVSDADVALLEVGDQAEVTLDGATDPVFGTISAIGLLSTSDSGVAAYPVTVSVTGGQEGLHDGVTADVKLIY